MDKKKTILYAASHIIVEKGFNQLTLELVANEANVSKGGLLYHFPTKEALLAGLNEYALHQFSMKIESELERISNENGKFIRAYALATIAELKDTNNRLLNSSLLASLANNSEALHLWKKAYEDWEQAIQQDGIIREKILTIRYVCDGLWFSSMFQLDGVEREESISLLYHLLDQLEEGN
ncbi:TetR/AcrR family transcriptional regulator [Metabacillus sp. HB246100]